MPPEGPPPHHDSNRAAATDVALPTSSPQSALRAHIMPSSEPVRDGTPTENQSVSTQVQDSAHLGDSMEVVNSEQSRNDVTQSAERSQGHTTEQMGLDSEDKLATEDHWDKNDDLIFAFRTKQMKARRASQVMPLLPPEPEFTSLLNAKKKLADVEALPPHQSAVSIEQARKDVQDAHTQLVLACLRLEQEEGEMKGKRARQENYELRKYADGLYSVTKSCTEEKVSLAVETDSVCAVPQSELFDCRQAKTQTLAKSPTTSAEALLEKIQVDGSLKKAVAHQELIKARLTNAKDRRDSGDLHWYQKAMATEEELNKAELQLHLLRGRRDKLERMWLSLQAAENAAAEDILVLSASTSGGVNNEGGSSTQNEHDNDVTNSFQQMTDIHGPDTVRHTQRTGVHPFNRPFSELQGMADQDMTDSANTKRSSQSAADTTCTASPGTDPFAISIRRPAPVVDDDDNEDSGDRSQPPRPVPFSVHRAQLELARTQWALAVLGLRDAGDDEKEAARQVVAEARARYLALGGSAEDLKPVNHE